MKVPSLVSRGTGEVRSVVIDKTTAAEIIPIVRANVAAQAHIMPDEHSVDRKTVQVHFAEHSVVRPLFGEYARCEVYNNTVEGYFSSFKRGVRGVYQWCRRKASSSLPCGV